MTTILAVRDLDSGRVLELREVTEQEAPGGNLDPKFVEQTYQKYPPPKFDVHFGVAESVEAFTRTYPRFGGGKKEGKDGAQADKRPGAGAPGGTPPAGDGST